MELVGEFFVTLPVKTAGEGTLPGLKNLFN